MNNQDMTIINDLMNKVGDDVAEAIRRNIQLVPPEYMLPITNRAAMHALAASAMIYDSSNKVAHEKIPTTEGMTLAVLVMLHQIIETDKPWDAAVADFKKYFPDGKVPQVEIIDRRRPKEAA